jgi:hypothetical protein
MDAAADAASGARAVLVNGLPEWAKVLAAECPGYVFSRCEVFRGKAVAAVRTTGPGPHVVITSDEAEMRAALGLPTSG